MNKNKEFVAELTTRILKYSAEIIEFIDNLPRDLSSPILARQLLRCATSIGANFVEAQAAPSRKDFANFLSIALKSANETRYWLWLFRQSRKGNSDTIEHLQRETLELANILGSIIKSTRKGI
jgi:four helix bundle protein